MKVLFKDREVQRLLDDYQQLIGVRIAIFDTEFNELYSSPGTLSPFCQKIRENDTINQACLHCDQKAFLQAKVNKDTYIYKCHLGLYEAVTPIYDQQQILGYVMIGQVLDNTDRESQWLELSHKLKEIKDFQIPRDFYNELKQMSLSEMDAVTRIMRACASFIWLQHIIKIERSPISERINNYIDLNYQNSITTKSICDDLNISKTTIYNYLKKEYNLSLNQYINKKRITKSKELLEGSTLPIASVATTVGFDDYNYYSRKFKEFIGVTPREHRRNSKH